MKDVVSIDVAEKDINAWLDHKRVNDKKRESNAAQIEALTEAVQMGRLSFSQDEKVLVQKLDIPLGKNGEIKELKYKSRMVIGEIHQHLKGVKSDDADGRLLAYVSALTNQTKGMIGQMDTEDYSISQTIAVFFL